jgi:hypothetical protein
MLKSNARLSLIFFGHGSRAPDQIFLPVFPNPLSAVKIV